MVNRWWVINEAVLNQALERAARGEPINEIMLDLDADTTREPYHGDLAHRVTFAISESPEGHLKLSINALDEKGSGGGYRIFGPKFDGRDTILREVSIRRRDAEEIRKYLDRVPMDTPPALRNGGPTDG